MRVGVRFVMIAAIRNAVDIFVNNFNIPVVLQPVYILFRFVVIFWLDENG